GFGEDIAMKQHQVNSLLDILFVF
nr:RecName: Full=Hemocyanin subunit 4 [Carcinus maenas]